MRQITVKAADPAAHKEAMDRTASFLTKLKWKITQGELDRMTSFAIDCIRFRFDPPLEQDVQYGMLEYMYTLDLTNLRSIAKTAMWLVQHGCNFRIDHAWNRRLPVRYNLVRFRTVRDLRAFLKRHHDTIPGYDLASDKIALRSMPENTKDSAS